MTHIADLDTPAVLIDLHRAEANLKRAQDAADAAGIALRPHIKTHKLPYFARRQIDLGAVGITVQKLGEAEVMADAGLTDLLLTFNIIGAAKLKRLEALHQRVTIRTVADSAECVAGLGATFVDPGRPLCVFVECDTGMGRCGVQSPQAALDLARTIMATPGLVFAGLMTYPAAGKYDLAAKWLSDARAVFADAGVDIPAITTGGTPDIWHMDEAARVATEYRPGTYIYMDRSQVAAGAATLEDCALTVLATVVSRPTENRAIIDAGSKALTSDLLGLVGHGHVVDFPEAKLVGLSEEHGTLDVSACARKPAIGERIRIVPNHCCPVTNLFDRVNLVRGGELVETLDVAARGRVD
ncbi:D-serine deaminase, pyridoxal phosphate-dependent [Devosia lucknowensis]|uniref:D-serine deaminase, pyridoxal phosphate-dependent n=1 Tax=Devosia lucknowensis TaxID=1096929 RepID=A0A1Y6GB40_9HYPH|nr:D-TA family PLP-dependent enzyme [Devosia lucknowensis]SMQ85299.1 D-serine deaminase, pyridoxal phosphate-dependent [Devosia lucknowensis]